MRVSLVTAVAAFSISALFGQQKPTVSVEAFDYSAVLNEVQVIFGTQQNIGVGIQSMMVGRIQRGGKFTVVERRKINTVMAEQDFGASGRVKRGSQARIGEIKGAQFTVFGDIVTFGRDDSSSRKSGGVVVLGIGGAATKATNTAKAVVTINFRMVNTETSEVVMSGEARGESKRESKSGGAGFIAGFVAAGGAYNLSSSNFAETILGEAIQDACDKLALQVESKASEVHSTNNAEIEGRVASVDGSTLYLNVGSSAGVAVGDRFAVSHVVKEVRDPVTKEVLDLQTTPAGTMTITSVREKISIGTMSGGAALVGDRAEKQ